MGETNVGLTLGTGHRHRKPMTGGFEGKQSGTKHQSTKPLRPEVGEQDRASTPRDNKALKPKPAGTAPDTQPWRKQCQRQPLHTQVH